MILARFTKMGTLYTIVGCTNMVIAATVDETKLWYTRLDHMSEKLMKILASTDKLSWLKSVNMEFFESSVYVKQKKVTCRKAKKEFEYEKLEFVPTYLWGPAPVRSLIGSR